MPWTPFIETSHSGPVSPLSCSDRSSPPETRPAWPTFSWKRLVPQTGSSCRGAWCHGQGMSRRSRRSRPPCERDSWSSIGRRDWHRRPLASSRAHRRDSPDLWPVLKLLEREGKLVNLDEDFFADAEIILEARHEVKKQLMGAKGLGPADFREVLPVTRKHLIPILSYFDRTGLTVRQGDGREVVAQGGRGSAEG